MNVNATHTDAAAIRNTDHTIDRALSALRDAAPRPGLEGRILTSLEHRIAPSLGGPSFHGLIVKGWGIVCGSKRENHRNPQLALWTAITAATLAIASLVVLHHSSPNKSAVILSGARGAEPKDPDAARRTTDLRPFSAANSARPTHTLSSRPERAAGAPGQLAGWGGAARSGETCISDPYNSGCPIHDDARVGMGGIAQSLDAQALADLHAPSHPAPPLPLTPQEKLFLRMLRYSNLTQLAELDSVVRAKQDADETTEFKAFFPDPPPLQQSNGDTE